MLKLNYRKELDGLRAIAIIGVIIYHVEVFVNGNKVFPGGFLGVDIFFVISGYLITLLIIKEIMSTNSFSFKNFYFRRAKRILPALIVMIFISIFFAWIYLTPKNFLQYSNSITSSLFFYSNYFFYFQDLLYNSEDSLLKPLLHTWSLAVEEQFYIFFPIFFLTIYGIIKKKLIIFFTTLIFVCFVGAIFITYSNSTLGFYSNFSRLWEVLFGSLLAVLEVKNKKINFKYDWFLPVVGFLLIIFSYIYFDKYMIHPSHLTLIPILGTFMIIHFIKVNDLTYNFLTIKFFSKIGLWSYSLYLWHYPIFAFARNRGKDLSEYDKIELLGFTFFVSLISYYLVEKPFRKLSLKKSKIFYTVVLLLSILLISFSYKSKNNNGFEDRIHVFLKNTTRENLWEKMTDQQGVCFERNSNFCSFNSINKRSVFLIGDSHVEVLNHSIYSRIKSYPLNYVSANRGGCIYLPNFEKRYIKNNNEYHNCTLESKKNIDRLIGDKKDSIIIIGGDFQAHFSDTLEWKYISKNNKNIMDSFKDSLNEILENNKVILVYPIPAAKFDVVKKIMNEVPKNNFKATEYLNKKKITTDYSYYLKRNKRVVNFFENIKHPNLYKIYPDQIFCDKIVEKKCFTHEGKDIFYSDKQHLSFFGAEKLAKKIFNQILEINNLAKN
jgi:peptidoglycan/LPS O-acetylase OafA/YrhL|tara:strand:+ start:244 stop:2232 length:1989 start_codon:yes stop_codon:yes gene_type:complete